MSNLAICFLILLAVPFRWRAFVKRAVADYFCFFKARHGSQTRASRG